MKPLHTSTPTPETRTTTHRQTPLDFTALVMRVVAASIVALACLYVLIGVDLPAGLRQPVNTLASVVLVVAMIYGLALAAYIRLQHYVAYGRRDPKPAAGDAPTVSHMRRNINIAGQVHQRDDVPVNWGRAEPKDVVAAIRFMRDTGKTSRNDVKGGVGISQGKWQDIMTALDSLDYVDNQGRGGVKIVGDLSAALDDFVSRFDL